jgi:hypothetical protein
VASGARLMVNRKLRWPAGPLCVMIHARLVQLALQVRRLEGDVVLSAVVIVAGLALAGGLLALGWLHWRGRVRFGRRQPAWGLGTMLFGLIQVACWLLIPGPPDGWLRLPIALAAAMLVGLWLTRRQGACPA